MKLPLTGGCQCGALRYEIRAEPLSVYVCHCTECQRQSGAAFGMSLMVPRPALIYVRGTPRRWKRKADSGRSIESDMCEVCGVRPVNHPSANDKISVVKPGTLDDTSWLHPVGHIWTRSAQPWVTIADGSVIHDGHPADVSGLIEAWKKHRATMRD
ncbi:GFA family protein [Pseudorhodoplanes sp.]|uniref:GFA family protein n=1 Tax=Pseudorhodoplanes sp. TaxID=1934341 RepID=UPI002B8E2F08|nr:GFA family protein [Pseudorhodoplanes sp.]HWV55673.1 GFA family protein [Pseudorhodoplanes sp.]